MRMPSRIDLASVLLLVPAGPPFYLQKDNLYLGNPYLGSRSKSPSLSWSPCTSHRATLGGDLQRVLSLVARGFLPQPPPGRDVENDESSDDEDRGEKNDRPGDDGTLRSV